ncbi:single-stranded DNA-binding protein [Actinotalea ferrariae]|uniref:single-stranded DNA-binding protein n=1 Tax=Actinotalea ferrariae TaxID=1386098 RepID=UPI001C8BFDC5|nr:single-stranded DNA-binding protein [Actinotalea ferrariae]MBX9246848.1 single-stranded DNA-binding protein [Actinotalea ferrariae]
MNAQGLSVTVVGWVATPPKEIVGGGVPYTSFRIATTPRRFDSRVGGWTDGRTEWITVKAFRDVAFNVAASVRKGDPMIVHGRLHTEEWTGENGPRTSLVLEASALGHDLTRGRTVFGRTVRVSGSDAEPTGGEGDARAAAAQALSTPDPWATDGAGAGLDVADDPDDPDHGDADDDVDADGDAEGDLDEEGAQAYEAGSAVLTP